MYSISTSLSNITNVTGLAKSDLATRNVVIYQLKSRIAIICLTDSTTRRSGQAFAVGSSLPTNPNTIKLAIDIVNSVKEIVDYSDNVNHVMRVGSNTIGWATMVSSSTTFIRTLITVN